MIKKLYVALASLLALLAFTSAQADVARSIVTTGVVEREPVDDVDTIPENVQKVIFFTDIRGMKDKKVSHVWKHNGEVMANVEFDVGGPRWRVWSSKNLVPEWAGDWTVSVVDEWGNTLSEKSFTYVAEEEAAPAEAMGEDAPAEEAAPAAEMKDEAPAEEMTGDVATDSSAGEMKQGE